MAMVVDLHYAVQVCDIASNQCDQRITGTTKTEISKRSIKSLLESARHLDSLEKGARQTIAFFNDHSSQELVDYLQYLKNQYNSNTVHIEIYDLHQTGLASSIMETYRYLANHGKDIVYQIQDDYLFYPSALYEMIDMLYQIKNDCDTDCMVMSFNPPSMWNDTYRYKLTPRTLIPGVNRYWIQSFDTSCSFLTTKQQFVQHLDIYEEFFSLLPKGIDGNLENITLNKIFTKRGVLGILPINSVAYHIQGEQEKDPYGTWKVLWDSIKI